MTGFVPSAGAGAEQVFSAAQARIKFVGATQTCCVITHLYATVSFFPPRRHSKSKQERKEKKELPLTRLTAV